MDKHMQSRKKGFGRDLMKSLKAYYPHWGGLGCWEGEMAKRIIYLYENTL